MAHRLRRLMLGLVFVPLVAGLLSLPTGGGNANAAEEVETSYGRMLLVLDSSGSMAERTPGGPTKMAAAKKALTRVVSELPEESAVGLRVYGATVFSRRQEGACTDSQLVVPPGTGNRDDLKAAIAGFEPYGETPIAHALREAAADIGTEGKRSVVLVSDGIATCAPDPCQVAGELADAGVDLQIDVVGLGVSGEARSQLQCIAEQGRGAYYNVATTAEIAGTLIRVSERAVRPFTLSGTPVEGTRTADAAPTIGQGQWTDVLGGEGSPDAVRHFRVERTIPDSTIHVTATTRGTPDKWDRISVSLVGPDGTECHAGTSSRNIDQYSVLSVGVWASRDALFPEEDCWQGDEVVVRVERGNDAETRSAPFALTVFEEPPATGVEQLPDWEQTTEYVAPSVSGPAETIVAGSTFADAPSVGTGRYALDIVPGESQIVRVPLDWGQQITARAVFPAGTPGVRELTGVQGPFADIRLYGSLLGEVAGSVAGTDSTAILPGLAPAELTAMSEPVRYRNRATYAGHSPVLPGDHFVVISANADHDGDTWIQPYTLELEVLGRPSGAPSYVGGAEVTQPLAEAIAAGSGTEPDPGDSPSASASEEAGAEEPAQRDPAGEEGFPVALAAGMGAGAAVLLVGLMVLLARRRGRRS